MLFKILHNFGFLFIGWGMLCVLGNPFLESVFWRRVAVLLFMLGSTMVVGAFTWA